MVSLSATFKICKLKLARLNEKLSNGIQLCNPVFHSCIHTLLKIVCTLPVSTAASERMFSNSKSTKTYLRNTVKEVNCIWLFSYNTHIKFKIYSFLNRELKNTYLDCDT